MAGIGNVVFRCKVCQRYWVTSESFFKHKHTHSELYPPPEPEPEPQTEDEDDIYMSCDSDSGDDNEESDSEHHSKNEEAKDEVQTELEIKNTKEPESPGTELIEPLPVRMLMITGMGNISSPTLLESSYSSWTDSEMFRRSEARTENGDGCSYKSTQSTASNNKEGSCISTGVENGPPMSDGQEDDFAENVFAGEKCQSNVERVSSASPEDIRVANPCDVDHISNNALENCSTNSAPLTQHSQPRVHRRERRPSVEYLFEKKKIDPRNRRKVRGSGEPRAPVSDVGVVRLRTSEIKSENKSYTTDVQDNGGSVDIPLDDSLVSNARIWPQDTGIGNNQEHEALNLQSGTSGIDSTFPSCSTSNDRDPNEEQLVDRIKVEPKRVKMEPKRKCGSFARRRHPVRKVMECSFCGIPLDQPVDPTTLKEGATEIPVSCTECRETFVDLRIEVLHSYHEKRYRCTKCGKVFQGRGTLIAHFRTHTKIPAWKSITPKLEKNPEELSAFQNTQLLPKTFPKLGHFQPQSDVSTSDTSPSPSPKRRFADIKTSPGINRSLRERSPTVREKMLLQQKASNRGVSERLNALEIERQARKVSSLRTSRKTKNSEKSRRTTTTF